MALIITALSLLGLVLLISIARTKEIGIRKLNGAKISDIIVLLNRDFVLMLVAAFLVATPIAWYTLHKWLQSFAYSTKLEWWFFILAVIIALGVAVLTVSLQSLKAATRNPVESLRYE
jgi:putative ABC transport system permease protein